uniref:Uncharacterized protein n=1 Tax=Meloidogyne enterolobii TaxID=390850 RepID=A0A6V7TJ05_MELEN|nr:unnamed protein product [Meloidogyne enterolobii]
MSFSIFNKNKSNKKQTMLTNIAALSIVVLQLLGQLNITEANYVGLGNHILRDGKVTLAEGSRVVNKKDMEQNMTISDDACDIAFDKEGNILLLYMNQGTIKDNGCTVDLLTNIVDEIVLNSGLNNSAGLGTCLRGDTINSNVLPFAYSLTNEEVKKFHNGPLFDNQYCPSCLEGCVKQTGLEVRWEYNDVREIEYAVFNANPIATKLIYFDGKELDMSRTYVKWKYSLIINQTYPKFHIRFSSKEIDTMFTEPSMCIDNPNENILSPSTWEIVGTSPEPTMNRLLVFHLLPQKASRKRMLMINKGTGFPEYVVTKDHPEGPKCDEMTIIFSVKNYSLLFTPVSHTTTSTTKDPTTPTITSSNIRDNQETTKISTIKPSFKVGLGDHILQDGKVILAKGSVVAKKEDLEQYMTSSADACDVDFDEGNIVLHYKSQGTTKDKGCTVDLLTDRKDEIVFWTGMYNRGGLYDCLNGSDINSNVLPFAYSMTNEEVKKFHKGPLFANNSCHSCLEGCVKKTD